MPYSYVPAFLLLVTTQNPNVLPNGSIFVPSVAPSARHYSASVPTNPSFQYGNLCGACNQPASAHYSQDYLDSHKLAWDECSISKEFVGTDRAYGDSPDKKPSENFEHTDRYGLPLVDYSGPGTTEDFDTDTDQYELDYDFTDDTTYYDKFPPDKKGRGGEQAGLLNLGNPGKYAPGTKGYPGNYSEPYGLTLGNTDRERSVYVEDNDGFITRQEYDPYLTDLYHKRLYNIYKDPQGFTRTGSIRFRNNTDGSISALCVQNGCNGINHIVPIQTTPTIKFDRDEMEAFLYASIRHGNNHAAKFIKQNKDGSPRSDYYKLHSVTCDLECNGLTCNQNAPQITKPKSLTDKETLDFLLHHKELCTTPECKCSEWITAMLETILSSNHNLKVSA